MTTAYVRRFPGQAGELGLLSESGGRPWAGGEGRGELGGDFRLQTERGGGKREAMWALAQSHAHSFTVAMLSGNLLGVLAGAEGPALHRVLHR